MTFLFSLIAIACLATVLGITTRRKINRYEEKIKRIKEKNEEVKYKLTEENKKLRSQLSLSPHRREMVDATPVQQKYCVSQASKKRPPVSASLPLALLVGTAFLMEKGKKR